MAVVKDRSRRVKVPGDAVQQIELGLQGQPFLVDTFFDGGHAGQQPLGDGHLFEIEWRQFRRTA